MGAIILVIEDNEQNRYLTRYLLEERGYTVVCAEDGPAGLAVARSRRPALILLDIQLPGMDGFQVLEHLQADSELSLVPVLAVTSHAMSGDRERILASGSAAYLEKPIDPAGLTDLVAQLLADTDA